MWYHACEKAPKDFYTLNYYFPLKIIKHLDYIVFGTYFTLLSNDYIIKSFTCSIIRHQHNFHDIVSIFAHPQIEPVSLCIVQMQLILE